MSITFLGLDEVLKIHADQIARYGGAEGVRDLGLLESAVAAAQTSFSGSYLHGTLPEMAAAYLFHVAQNHPFVDGNVRRPAQGAHGHYRAQAGAQSARPPRATQRAVAHGAGAESAPASAVGVAARP